MARSRSGSESADGSAPRAAGRRPRGAKRAHGRAGDVLYGVHPVREALRARRRALEALWLREGARRPELEALAELADGAGVPVEWVARERIETAVGDGAQSQGVALFAGPLPELALEELVAAAARRDPGPARFVALDGVEDPQNVGAIARVADSAGAAGLILTERRASPLSPVVAKASAGAIEWLPVARVTNLGAALEELRESGFWSVGATSDEGANLHGMSDRLLAGPLVVVLGAEGRGIRPGVLAKIDHRVRIPMWGRVESLNVATAAAVLLYDLARRDTDSRGE